jgi:hypothetical protein
VKRSTSVAVPLLASAALAMLAGCKQEQMQRCVDAHNVVVDDSFCANQQNPPNNNNGNYPGIGFYRWYYGGVGNYYPGSIATGGGYAPVSGFDYATSRGGFGTSSGVGGHGGVDE